MTDRRSRRAAVTRLGAWVRRARYPIFVLALAVLATARMASAEDYTPSRIYADNFRSVVQFDVVRRDGNRVTATGFVIAPGVVATNAHVVRDFGDGRVLFGEPPSQAAIERVIAAWPEVDLALVSVPATTPERASALTLAPASAHAAPRIGEPLYIIGNPGGLTNSFAQGLMSGRRQLDGFDTMQLTVSATHGSSGSPVFDRNGRVVGMVRSTAIRGTDIVLATPVSYLREMLTGRHTERWKPRRGATADTNLRLPGEFRRRAAVLPRGTPAEVPGGRNGSDAATIVFGVPRWITADATAHILKTVIEKRFPYRVELRRGTNADVLAEIARNDGAYDVHVEVWLPNHQHLWDAYVRGRENVATGPAYTGFQGFCVNGAASEQYDIRSIDDLADRRRAALFDSDGDGRGEIWIGDPGWSATNVNRVKARDHGLSDLYELSMQTESDYLPELERKLAAGVPVAFYCYLPHWLGTGYDIVTLTEPPYAPDCYFVRDPTLDPDWFERSVAKCSGPTPQLQVVYSRRLERKAPGVAELLSGLALTTSTVSEWARRFKEDGRHPREVAERWVARNPSYWTGTAGPHRQLPASSPHYLNDLQPRAAPR